MIVFTNKTKSSSPFTNGSVKVKVRTINRFHHISVSPCSSWTHHSLTHYLHCQVLMCSSALMRLSDWLQSITGFCTSYQWNAFSLSRVLPSWHRKVFPGVRGKSVWMWSCRSRIVSGRVSGCYSLMLRSEIQRQKQLINKRKMDFLQVFWVWILKYISILW